MKISDMLQERRTLSFEVFPPKMDQPVEPLMQTLSHLYAYRPDFISCTYGAGGTNKGRQAEILRAIKESGQTEPLAHFTCIGNTFAAIREGIRGYTAIGVENALALRGDLPADWEGTRGDFDHADGLIAYIRSLCPALCLSGACYPEKHIAASSFDEDIAHLLTKQENGASFLMSQLCHDVDAFSRFYERIRRAGVTLPVVVGVMPVLKKDPIIRMTLSNACSIPRELAAIIGRYGDDPASFKAAGKAYTVEQIQRYLAAGIDGLHFYSLNQYQDIAEIIEAAGIAHA